MHVRVRMCGTRTPTNHIQIVLTAGYLVFHSEDYEDHVDIDVYKEATTNQIHKGGLKQG